MRSACRVLDCRAQGSQSAWGLLCAAHLHGVDECAGCRVRFNGPAEMASHLKHCWPQTVQDVQRVKAAIRREGREAEFGLEPQDHPVAARTRLSFG